MTSEVIFTSIKITIEIMKNTIEILAEVDDTIDSKIFTGNQGVIN